MNYHSGARIQRGRGIGSLFSGLIRGFAPIARMGLQAGKKLLTSDFVKNIGRSALEGGKTILKDVAADLIEGNNVEENAQKNLQEARKRIAGTIRGSGIKRKRKQSNHKIKFEPKNKRHKRYNLFD
jgi:exonuclease VII small subunit